MASVVVARRGLRLGQIGGVRKMDQAKFKSLVHYICAKCEDHSKLGAIKLNKVLLYSEREAFLRLGAPITGARFVKRQFGPVPIAIVSTLEELQGEGAILIRDRLMYGKQKRDFINLKEADCSMFTAQEISIVDRVTHEICFLHTARSISEKTHDDVWEMAQIGEEIPLFTVFAVQGEVDETDIAWAQEKLAARQVSAA